MFCRLKFFLYQIFKYKYSEVSVYCDPKIETNAPKIVVETIDIEILRI